MFATHRSLRLVLMGTSLAVLAGGLWFYTGQRRQLRRDVGDHLTAIATLKVDQLTRWREERLNDGAELTRRPFLIERIARWLAHQSPAGRDGLLIEMELLLRRGEYTDVLLVDPQGRVRLSLSGRGGIGSAARDVLATALREGRPVLTDLHSEEENPAPHLSVVAPLSAGVGTTDGPLGAIVLVCDARRFLFPLVESWPTASRTGETVLVRRDGNDVLFLNELRHPKDPAIALRIPLDRVNVPAVMAVAGIAGLVQGPDYRGVDVLAFLSHIPDSSWFLVAKIDAAEAFAEWRFRAALILILMLSIGALTVAGEILISQRSEKAHLLALLRTESSLLASEARHAATLRSIGDGVIATDATGRIELMNPVAETLTGWSAEEARGKALEQVFTIVNEETRAAAEHPVTKVLRDGLTAGLANHTVLIARDGTARPIADSGAPIRDDKGDIVGVVLVFRDQTAERAAQKALEVSEARYADLYEDAPDMYFSVDPGTGRIVRCNRTLLRTTGYTTKEVIGQELFDLYQPGCLAQARRAFERFVATGEVRDVQLAVRRKDGEALDVSLSVTAVRDRAGQILQSRSSWRDISEHKRAERALLRTDELLQRMSAMAHIGAWEFDPATGEGTWTEEVAAIHDVHPDQKTSMRFGLDFFHGESRRSIETAVDEAIRSGTPYDLELELVTATGARKWVRTQGVPEMREGRVVRVRGAIQDITDRRQAEQELRRTERRIEFILGATKTGLDIIDSRHNVRYIDPEWQKAYGDPQGRKCYEYFMGRTEPCVDCGMRKALETRAMAISEEVLPKEGNRQVQVTSIPYQDESGEWVVAEVNLDITERKRAEAERLLLATGIEQAAEIVVVTDPEGTIRYVNPSFEAVTGYTKLEAVGQNPRILNSGKQDAAFYRELWQTIGGGKTWRGRFVNKRKDGTLYTEDASISPVRDSTGAITEYVAVKRDITRELSIEAQLLQAQKMEPVGRLAGGVAHDFNNMLQVIMGYTEFALGRVAPTDQLYTSLQSIRQAAQRSAELTQQLLAFARKQTAAPKVLELNDAVAGTLSMLRQLIGEDIDLAWIPRADLWKVRLDPSQLDQVLANLTVNARDAIAGVGTLTVETDNRTFDEAYCSAHVGYVAGEYVMLAVSDSGSGMDKSVLEHLFEPFFTTKPTGKGTGLGLATVYGIVKQNDGFINVYSEPGNGTTFRIYLPRYAAEATASAPSVPIQTPRAQGETVLLAEDDAAILELGKLMLTELGYRVIAANTPAAALDLVAQHRGDLHLLMTDVVMPEMNGRELARRIGEMKPGVRCLFMSGYSAEVIAHRGVLEEGVRFIQKPFSLASLAASLRQALDGT